MPFITDETLLRYCTLLYDKLKSEAEGDLWEGKIVETFGQLAVSNAHYGVVMQSLYNGGCIVQERRGARGVRTQIRLVRPPDAGQISLEHNANKGLTSASSPATLALAKVEEMERRFGGIDLPKVLANFEQRLRTLELERGKG